MSALQEAIRNMPHPGFYPSRDADVYVESHSCAGGGRYWTIWVTGLPAEVNLDEPSRVARFYARFARADS